jgi:predicted secreted Zn-dependent protease
MSTDFGATEWPTYDVSGATLADAAAAIAHLPEAGQTEWWPTYNYQTDEHGHVSDVTLTIATRVTLPTWSGYQSASGAEQQEWDRFAAALLAHEQGHLDIVVSHFNGLDQHMIGVAHDHARAVFQQAQHNAQAASNAYDAQTSHGQHTGTIIDISVVPVTTQ